MDKVYSVLLDNKLIGTTSLEKADASMGVVFGQIKFLDILNPYDFVKLYCNKNKIDFNDYPDDKLISTRTIPTLKIINDKGVEIKGSGNQISGTGSDGFELSIEGIPYPLYGNEFPQHVKADEERFKR